MDADLEERARELLADAYVKHGMSGAAHCVRSPAAWTTRDNQAVLSAIEVALSAGQADSRRLDMLVGLWAKPEPFTREVAAVIESFKTGDAAQVRTAIDAAIAASGERLVPERGEVG